MQVLHCPSNLKVHLAGTENKPHFHAARIMGCQYFLYTCFPWVYKRVFGNGKASTNKEAEIPELIAGNSLHAIQDSGLFTLLFGAMKDAPKDVSLINKWYDGLVDYTVNHGQPVTCVEVDAQKFLGPELTWEIRMRLRRDLPAKNRIINVFHLEDGKYGLDRMIEYADYIAISVPEMRIAGKSATVPALARYIKNKKPSIDIHLLGCTELGLLKQCRFCTSSDSTSWISGMRYGFLENHHINSIKESAVAEFVGVDKWDKVSEFFNSHKTSVICASIETAMRSYEKAAGPQDYRKPKTI